MLQRDWGLRLFCVYFARGRLFRLSWTVSMNLEYHEALWCQVSKHNFSTFRHTFKNHKSLWMPTKPYTMTKVTIYFPKIIVNFFVLKVCTFFGCAKMNHFFYRNEIRKTQNIIMSKFEHSVLVNLIPISWLFWVYTTYILL